MRTLSVLLCAALVGCDLLSPKSELSVATDSSVYHRTPSGNAHVTYQLRNVALRTLYFAGCGTSPVAAHIDQAVDAQWKPVFEPGVYCLQGAGSAGLALPPGAAYRDSLLWDIPATYRMRVLFGTSPDNAFAHEAPGVAFEIH